MKNMHGKFLDLVKEMELLAQGYEWYTSYEFEKIIKPEGVEYHVAAVDRVNGKNEMYLVLVGGAIGYWAPTATTGCRLRTGNPDFGR